MSDRATFSRTVTQKCACARCGARYEYDRVLSTERPRHEVAEADVELARQQAADDMAIVRCPRCGKYAPGAIRNRLLSTGMMLGLAALCAAACLGLIVLAGMTGRFFWLLALAAGLGAAWFALLALIALLMPTTAKTRPTLG
jgi:DNA-directed RNA polymerase subunit RPC12/RpoP